ncbi:hypothetical protein AB0N05_37845 [Nocardia sp. NPDC051030]|uniref:hypothetical protein n=1 Tax=Nocardia sp. NPDC051030 TaxID=3155162 RepID=UPI003413BE21
MSDKDVQLSYTLWHEWWNPPARSSKPMVNVRMETEDGLETAWEFDVIEVAPPQADGTGSALDVSIFTDGFPAFHSFAPFFAELATRRTPSFSDVVEMLDKLGAIDLTERTAPAETAATR